MRYNEWYNNLNQLMHQWGILKLSLRFGDQANIFIYKICVILKEMGNLYSTLQPVGGKGLTYIDTTAEFSPLVWCSAEFSGVYKILNTSINFIFSS